MKKKQKQQLNLEKIGRLNRKEARVYLMLLKRLREKERVSVSTAIAMQKGVLADLKGLFKDREVIVKTDPTLIFGLTLIADDFLLDASMKGVLERLNEYEIN